MFEKELKKFLLSLGASLVDFADLSQVHWRDKNAMNHGVSIAAKLNSEVIRGIIDGPTVEYYNEYKTINEKLDNIALACVEFINDCGYCAVAQTSAYVTSDDKLATSLPHKTVATRAGLGWIGKNALLITEEYGSAIRLTSVITDMPLENNQPINKSKCGGCTSCMKACPAGAVIGNLWDITVNRDQLINPYKCMKKARELLMSSIGMEATICGKCIAACPYTRRYINEEGR